MKTTLLNKYKRHLPSLFDDFDDLFNGFRDDFLKYPNYLDRSGGSLLTNWSRRPLINVSETDKEYNIELSVPGFSKEDVKIEIEDGVITIAGFKKTENSNEYSYSEFSSSSFERKLSVPTSADEDSISAKHENGILTLTIPKLEVKKVDNSRKIKID